MFKVIEGQIKYQEGNLCTLHYDCYVTLTDFQQNYGGEYFQSGI